MATETVENYLKAIYSLCRQPGADGAGMSRIAAAVGVTTGTATAMVKRLAADRLVRYERFGTVTLSAAGERAAMDILRRHRLVETFLVQTLRLDWTQVHQEAERLEHALSPVVLEALDRHLGHPTTDPHGDPIPDPQGRIRDTGGGPMSSFGTGDRLRVLRVTDQGAEYLAFAARHGLRPGAEIEVVSQDEVAQTMVVRGANGEELAIGLGAAAKVLCEIRAGGGLSAAGEGERLARSRVQRSGQRRSSSRAASEQQGRRRP